MNKKVLISTALCGAIALAGCSFFTYQALAGKDQRIDQVSQLKAEFQEERAKLESMPNTTPEEIEQTVIQGKKVKEKGLEIGKLEKEVNDNPKKELEDLIQATEGVFAENTYKELAKENKKFEKSVQTIEKKKEILAQIKKDLKDGTKTIEELRIEFNAMVDMPVDK
jgi:molecular chaperone DnaK (HSP70)